VLALDPGLAPGAIGIGPVQGPWCVLDPWGVLGEQSLVGRDSSHSFRMTEGRDRNDGRGSSGTVTAVGALFQSVHLANTPFPRALPHKR